MNSNAEITLTIEELVQLLLSPQLPNIQSSLLSLCQFEFRNNHSEVNKDIVFSNQEQSNHNNRSNNNTTSLLLLNKMNGLQIENDNLKNKLEQHIMQQNSLQQQLNQYLSQQQQLKQDNQILQQKMDEIQISYNNKKIIKNRHDAISKSVHRDQEKIVLAKSLALNQPLRKFSGCSGVVTQYPFGNSKRNPNNVQTARSNQ
ncbi:unnamed protein product (macronuclear) [Paramecium tetraurelia]|uniref:Uncharacterized protein n=1 Tax=Paramecium tetraurelia TaxID=5888 RepID=A0CQI8_PARTE|nr:uncharacterized protein GSPATT00009403001 [Paramecium tetraurelia]CAK73055.1 unnamed protein product [Paramecium tetraurelia]|eukprot:XP_001440452.1 hypothetical protein (macronuclear) [Paramecium tetraurelia strain d4-2]